MTQREIADFQSLTREFLDFKTEMRNRLNDVDESLAKMLPTKTVTNIGKVFAWIITTSIAVLATIVYWKHK